MPRAGAEPEDRHGEDILDEQALAALRAGDDAAWRALVARHGRRVLALARGIVRDATEAEEIAQEAFVRAWQRLDRFRRGVPFGPWVCRIATNLALDVARRRRRFPADPIEAHLDAPALRAPAVCDVETARRIDAAIEALPGMQRIVARLYIVAGFGHDEIASLIGMSEATSRSHLSLARGKLREALSDLYGGSK